MCDMTKDKKILCFVSAALLALLLLILFLFADGGRIYAAILLPAAALAICFLFKKRAIHSIYKRQVLLIMAVTGVLCVVLYYLSGMSFGFGRSLAVGWSTLFEYILPIISIIVSTEIIRGVLLAGESRVVSALAFLLCVVAEILALGDVGRILSFNLFMNLLGITVFPAVTGNVLYHYLSKRYGVYPNIAYRLITSLYLYVFYYVPNMPSALLALVKLLIPFIIYFFIDALFEKKRRYAVKKRSKLSYIPAIAGALLMVCVAMIISCQFRFGLLVIASESMADEIDKGDAVVYERYEEQMLEVGDVIVFEHDGVKVVHRIIDIKRIDSQNRYYTKGDANEDPDPYYVTDGDIIGVFEFKIAFIGYPSIWLRETVKF